MPATNLYLEEHRLAPGEEWSESLPAWQIMLVSGGAAYWLGREGAQSLDPGAVLVIGPASQGTLRASLLSAITLHRFVFSPEQLAGLLSVAERLSLEARAADFSARVLGAADAVAREFQNLVATDSNARGFSQRCRLLSIISLIFGDAPVGHMPRPTAARVTSESRFEEMMERLSESELIACSVEKLAEMCGCSSRHFRRLFRRRFNTSIRTKQGELRLEKARQLLVETDEKIVQVAFASGFRHLGFFNATFKKKFGLTPGEWRRDQRSAERKVPSAVAH